MANPVDFPEYDPEFAEPFDEDEDLPVCPDCGNRGCQQTCDVIDVSYD